MVLLGLVWVDSVVVVLVSVRVGRMSRILCIGNFGSGGFG